MNTRRWANGLGWFSIALGITEIVAAKTVAKSLGLKSTALVRLFGVREIVSGLGILAREQKGKWIWARVAGDVLDVAVLGSALRGPKARNAALAMTAVSPVVALDVICGKRLGLAA